MLAAFITAAQWIGFSRNASLLAATLAIAMALPMGAAHAGVPKAGLSQERTAYAQFEALAAQTEAVGVMPRLSDPKAGPILHQFWDADAVLGHPPYAGDDLKALGTIQSLQGRLLKQYLLFTPTPGQAADTSKNTLLFQPEVARGTAFLVAWTAAMLDGFYPEVAARERSRGLTKADKANVLEVQGNMSSLFLHAIETIKIDGIRPENRKIIAAALAQYAPRVAAQITPAQRSKVRTAAESLGGKVDADTQALLDKVAAAMSQSGCAELCAVSSAGEQTQSAHTTHVAPVIARYYALVGDWRGHEDFVFPNYPRPVREQITLSCSKQASGSAVRCEWLFWRGKQKSATSTLVGADAQGDPQVFAVTSDGHAYSNPEKWIGAHSLKGWRTWADKDKQLYVSSTLTFRGSQTIEVHGFMTKDGKIVQKSSGILRRE